MALWKLQELSTVDKRACTVNWCNWLLRNVFVERSDKVYQGEFNITSCIKTRSFFALQRLMVDFFVIEGAHFLYCTWTTWCRCKGKVKASFAKIQDTSFIKWPSANDWRGAICWLWLWTSSDCFERYFLF